MRPKKIVLLVDSDEDRMSETRCILHVAGFKVLSSVSADSARKTEQFFDVVVGYWPIDWRPLGRLSSRTDNRFILVCPALTGPPANVFADAVLTRGEGLTARLIERIKFACARKRGPKPAPKTATHETKEQVA